MPWYSSSMGKIGVDYMVVGRPITKAKDPREAALKIVEEIGGIAE